MLSSVPSSPSLFTPIPITRPAPVSLYLTSPSLCPHPSFLHPLLVSHAFANAHTIHALPSCELELKVLASQTDDRRAVRCRPGPTRQGRPRGLSAEACCAAFSRSGRVSALASPDSGHGQALAPGFCSHSARPSHAPPARWRRPSRRRTHALRLADVRLRSVSSRTCTTAAVPKPDLRSSESLSARVRPPATRERVAQLARLWWPFRQRVQLAGEEGGAQDEPDGR